MIKLLKNIEYKIQDNGFIVILISFYARFIDFCATPFEKMQTSNLKIRISNFYRNNPRKDYLFLILIVSFISLLVFHKFIFGKYVFIYNEYDVSRDCINGLYPYINHIFYNKEGLSFWSFNSGLGNNMFIILMTFFVDPFNILTSILWNPIENGFIYIHILKLICIALIFYRLILKLTQNRFVAIFTSLLFTFNGFLMLWGQHYYFVNKVLYFIILLYAIELFLDSKNRFLLIFALILNLTDVYFFYQCVFFVGFYLIFRNFYFEGNLKGILKQILSILPFGILAFLLSAFFVMPSVYILGSGPRVISGKFDTDTMVFSMQSLEYYLTLFSRFFSNNLSGDGINYFGYSRNYMVAPQVYSGLIMVLLAPQVLSVKDTKTKKALIAIVMISFITLIFPFFAYLFNAFQELYYRWTFGIIVLNVISVALILNSVFKSNELNLKILRYTFLCLFISLVTFLIYYRGQEEEWIGHDMMGLFTVNKGSHIFHSMIPIGILLVLYFLLLELFIRFKFFVGISILLLFCAEVVIENNKTFYNRGIVEKNHNPYNDSSQKVIQKIHKNDKMSFYRIEKQFYSFGRCSLTSNDALVHDYYGLKTYNSYNQKSYYDFCLSFGLIKKNHWANLLPSLTPNVIPYDLVNILSVKYLLSKEKIIHNSYKKIDQVGDILVYKNKNFLPIGYTYSSYLSKKQLALLPDSDKHKVVFNKVILEDEDKLFLKSFLNSSDSENKRKLMKMNYFSNSLIKGEICNPNKSLLFFSIPYDKGWNISVNHKPVKYYKVNIGFIGVPLEEGMNSVELSYSPPFFKLGLLISGFTFFLCMLFLFFSKWKKVKS